MTNLTKTGCKSFDNIDNIKLNKNCSLIKVNSDKMALESDDEDEEMPDFDGDGKIKPKPKRVRQYTQENSGPFVVHIRAIDEHTPLKAMKLTKFIFGTCSSEISIRQVNEKKIRVTFAPKDPANLESCDQARREANALPFSEWSSKYKVYIPEKLVEVMGCISWSIKESVEDFMTAGEGKFRNNFLPSVKILDAIRFMRKPEGKTSEPQIEKTNVVRITFAGLLLPEFVNLYGLLIPVREFRRRQMFCENCLNYNHTKSHCSNKPRKEISESCLQCQGNHPSGDINCPRRKFIEKRESDNEKNLRKKTYAEMLQHYDPNSIMPGETNDDINPMNLGTRKERLRNQSQGETSACKITPLKKRKLSEAAPNEPPPGFKVTNVTEEDDITSFINSIFEDIELPQFIKQLINKYFVPIIHKFISNITNSLIRKVSLLASQ